MVRATYGDPSLSIPDDDFQRWLRSGWRSMTEKEFFRTCWGKDDRSR